MPDGITTVRPTPPPSVPPWLVSGATKEPEKTVDPWETKAYQDYVSKGGVYSFDDWKVKGRPMSPTPEEILNQVIAGGTTGEGLLSPAVSWKTVSEGGWDYMVSYDKNGVEVGRDPLGQTYRAPTVTPPTTYPQPTGNIPTDQFGRTATWDRDNDEWRYPPDWGEDPATKKPGYVPPITPYQQADIDLQRQNLLLQQQDAAARLEAQKQERLASLRASPASWLEYASLAGQQPAIQPWMLPLMPQQYAGTVAGAPIPGWSAGAPTMAELPELTTPSRQYQARLGPTGEQQYYGYQKARTGAPIEESQWRLWSSAPPGGTAPGLNWMR